MNNGGIMKSNKLFILVTMCCLLSTVLLGCATIKDLPKGIAGVSTRVLEDSRKDALKKSFALSYNDCYAKVKDVLVKNTVAKDTLDNAVGAPYIYSDDSRKKMIAIYLSETDTTPVGIFFTEESATNTLIEVSSPSIYAKEEISKKIFSGIDALINSKDKPAGSGLASDSQSQKKIDVKEKTNN